MLQKILLLVVVVVILVAALMYSQRDPGVEQTSGFIEVDKIRLGSRVGGRVARVQVEEGQEVSEGQVLINLEPCDLLARQHEARATLCFKASRCT